LDIVRGRGTIPHFLSQPFHVAEVFTRTPGKYVALKDTIRGSRAIRAEEALRAIEKLRQLRKGG